MNVVELSLRQEMNRQILAARRVAARHSAGLSGKCPVCGFRDCDPWVVAQGFLKRYSEPPEPILRTER